VPVIGRLDGQVDKVLITPLERGRERPADEADDADAPPPQPPAAPAPEPSAGETSRARDELPVWLL
jgi:hypothetical protein